MIRPDPIMIRTLGRRLGATLAAMVALAAGGGPLSAQSKQLEIERFDAEITVAESGRVHVSEAIRFRFTGSWNGVYRDIPVVYRTPSGFNLRLKLDVRSVTAEDGTALRYEESRERHYKRIKKLGEGAFGKAFLCQCLNDRTLCVIKQVNLKDMTD